MTLNTDYSNSAMMNAPSELNMTAWIYDSGVMRVIVGNPSETESRF